MLALRLVRLIETHSDDIARQVVQRIRSSHHASAYKGLPDQELAEIGSEVYRHLGEWLTDRTQADIERFFTQKAQARIHGAIPLSDVVWMLMVTKEALWRYVHSNVEVGAAFELLGELELVQALDQFFDRGIYYVTLAYERGGARATA